MKHPLIAVLLCLSCGNNPPKKERAKGQACKMTSLRVSFDDAPLTEVARAVGDAACVRLQIDEALRAERITLFSTAELSPSDLLSSFKAALTESQLEVTEEGGEYTIKRTQESPTH